MINPGRLVMLFLLIGIVLAPLSSCSNDDPEGPELENPNANPQPDPDPDPDPDPTVSTTSIIRINSGGPEVSFGSITFVEDVFFSTADSEPFTNPDVTEIADTEQDEIYLTERISIASNGTYSYNIPITNGDYRVILHFAEIFWGQPGVGASGGSNDRIFDVILEGTTVIDNYDIFTDVGGATATTQTFITTVSDEELNILFTATTNKPKISAIEIQGDGSILN